MRPASSSEVPLRSTTAVLLTVSALVAGLFAAGAAPAAAAPPAAPVASAPVAATSTPLPDGTVTLVTGDQVVVTHDSGRQSVLTHAADRGDGTAPVGFSMFALRGDTFVVPSDAAAY